MKLSLKKSEAVLYSLSELFMRKSSSLIDFLPLLLHLNDDVTLFTVPVLDFGQRPRRTSVVCETFSIMRLKGLTGSLYQPQIIRHVRLSRKSQTNQRNERFSPLSLMCSVTELWCKNTFEPNSVVFASYCRECPFIMELHYPAALVQSFAYQLSCLL